MKKTIAFLFLSVYLISTTELHQFLKLPLLVEHFSEHKQKNASITFWDFLCLHYANGSPKDSDYEKDAKLPFKTLDDCNSTTHISLLPEQKFCLNTTVAPTVKRALNNHYSFCLGDMYLNSIWQPPQFS